MVTEQNLVAVMNTVAETLTYPIKLDEALEQITSGAAATVPESTTSASR